MKKTIGYASFLFICYLAYKQVKVNGLFDNYRLQSMERRYSEWKSHMKS